MWWRIACRQLSAKCRWPLDSFSRLTKHLGRAFEMLLMPRIAYGRRARGACDRLDTTWTCRATRCNVVARTQHKVAWEEGCRRQCRDWRLDGKIVMVAIPRAHTHAEAAVRRAE
jgi:hypothetical protein